MQLFPTPPLPSTAILYPGLVIIDGNKSHVRVFSSPNSLKPVTGVYRGCDPKKGFYENVLKNFHDLTGDAQKIIFAEGKKHGPNKWWSTQKFGTKKKYLVVRERILFFFFVSFKNRFTLFLSKTNHKFAKKWVEEKNQGSNT